MKQFKIGIVGAGNVAQMHFEAYAAHPDRIRMAAVCDPEFDRVKQAQEKYGIEKGFQSVEEMLEGADWEVAIVCTPTPVRKEVVGKLSAAGKHVFVEKPFADTYAEAQGMVKTCSEAGVTLAVNQNFRYHYPFDMARQLIADGDIGNVLGVSHQNLQFRQDTGWRTTTTRHSMSIMGVHWFDGFRWMLGDTAKSIVGEIRSSPVIECNGETETWFQVVFDQGTVVSYVESFSSGLRKTETVVIGDRGTLRFDYGGLELYDLTNRDEAPRKWDALYPRERKPEATFVGLDAALSAIEAGVQPPNSGRDNLETISLLDGAYQAASEHKKIELVEGVLA